MSSARKSWPLKGNQPRPAKKPVIKRLKMTLQDDEALSLRLQGHTFRTIAAQLGVVSPQTAYEAYQRALTTETASAADRANQRLESDAFYRLMIRQLMPLLLRKKPNLDVVNPLIKLRQRLDEIWGLDLGKQLERDGISDALLAVLHEVQHRPLALPATEATLDGAHQALPGPESLEGIWEEMERSGEVEQAASPDEES